MGSSAIDINTTYSSPTNVYENTTVRTLDIGDFVISDPNTRMAFYIYDLIANIAWNYLKFNVNWDNDYNLAVQWYPGSTNGTFYELGGAVHLIGGDRWDSDVILHEYSHFVMYKIYILYPPTPNCTIHSWSSISSQGCAWSEGWANFLQAAIQNDQYYDDTEDQNIHRDYEPPNPIAQGADVEGAVTASLWDIYDSHIEDWDSISLGINSSNSNGIWNVVYNRMPNTTIEFIGDWVTSNIGYNCEVETIFSHHKIGGNCIYIPLMIR